MQHPEKGPDAQWQPEVFTENPHKSPAPQHMALQKYFSTITRQRLNLGLTC